MMLRWLRSIFSKRSEEIPQPNAEANNDILERFEIFLTKRMHEFHHSVRDAFSAFFKAELAGDIQGLHIEILLDDPAFSFRIFSKGKDDVWADEPTSIQELNDTIDSLWPIITEDELDQYMIWEDGPKGRPQVALEQPLDKLNIPRIAIPWFKKIVSETKGDFSRPVTASVHDITMPEEL